MNAINARGTADLRDESEGVKQFADEESRWNAIVARDRAADGVFYFSVATTGVFCRPGCGARLPKRENVRFHDSLRDAERAGFRACKRCRPDAGSLDAGHREIVEGACRAIEDAEEPPSLGALADAAGLSTFHFQRLFKAKVGVTPKKYAEAHRAGRVREGLERGASVTEAVYDAGFNSSGRFYAASNVELGMTPRTYRQKGKGEEIRFAVGESTLGAVLVAATERGVCAISLGDDRAELVRALQDRFSNARLVPGGPDFNAWVAAAVEKVEHPESGFGLPLDIRGTAFQRRVWQALREIPAGSVATYSEIAGRLGSPGSARAVAGACAANLIAVAVPCHRVVRTDDSLAGYRWGAQRKAELLKRERKRRRTCQR